MYDGCDVDYSFGSFALVPISIPYLISSCTPPGTKAFKLTAPKQHDDCLDGIDYDNCGLTSDKCQDYKSGHCNLVTSTVPDTCSVVYVSGKLSAGSRNKATGS